MYACEEHICEVRKVHTQEMDTREMREVHVCEVCDVHTRQIYTCEVREVRYIRVKRIEISPAGFYLRRHLASLSSNLCRRREENTQTGISNVHVSRPLKERRSKNCATNEACNVGCGWEISILSILMVAS